MIGRPKKLKLPILAVWIPAGSGLYCTQAKGTSNSLRHFWKSSGVVPDSWTVKQTQKCWRRRGQFVLIWGFSAVHYLMKQRGFPVVCTLRAQGPSWASAPKSHNPKATHQGLETASCLGGVKQVQVIGWDLWLTFREKEISWAPLKETLKTSNLGQSLFVWHWRSDCILFFCYCKIKHKLVSWPWY